MPAGAIVGFGLAAAFLLRAIIPPVYRFILKLITNHQ